MKVYCVAQGIAGESGKLLKGSLRDLLASRNIKNFGIEKYRRDYGNSNACGENMVVDRLVETGIHAL